MLVLHGCLQSKQVNMQSSVPVTAQIGLYIVGIGLLAGSAKTRAQAGS